MIPDNLTLSESELAKLVERFGEADAADRLEALSLWKASKGKKTKSDYATILNWERMDRKRGIAVSTVTTAKPEPGYLEVRVNAIYNMFKRDFERGLRPNLPSLEEIRLKVASDFQ